MMGGLLLSLVSTVSRFREEEGGAVLAETLIVVPFVTLFSVGILEFGNMFWQKEQIETGLRDAARYVARCQPDNPTSGFTSECGDDIARDIAFYGTASPGEGAGLRVPGWDPDDGSTIGITRTGEVIRVETSYGYDASPLFAWLGLDDDVTIQAFHEERYIGW